MRFFRKYYGNLLVLVTRKNEINEIMKPNVLNVFKKYWLIIRNYLQSIRKNETILLTKFKLLNNDLSVYESRQSILLSLADQFYFSLCICTFCNNYNLSCSICVVFYIVNNHHCFKIFIRLKYISLIYFKTKQDIQILRLGFVATNLRSNKTNIQRSWLLDKGTEPLK